MKHKFLITNDVGLSLDKVKYLLEQMQENGGELYGSEYGESLNEIVSHLEQALAVLGEELEDV